MPLLDFSPQTLRTLANNLGHCRTLTDAEKYLRDAFPKLTRSQAWGIWDGFTGRPESIYETWSEDDRRGYLAGRALGMGIGRGNK